MGPFTVHLRLAGLLLAALWVHGCQPQATRIVLLESPVEVTANPVLGGASPEAYEITVRGTTTPTRIRTTVTDLNLAGRAGGRSTAVEAVLRDRAKWQAPYLFVREDNGGGNAWRSDVDHVFKLTAGGTLHRLGTLTARFGPPGSQLQDGRFLDIYDRLEFSPLTSHAMAPGFTLVLLEKELKFSADLERTWERGKTNFEASLAKLSRHATNASSTPRLDEAQRREIRGLALQCLAFARYCRRIAEYDASLDLARLSLGEIEEIQEAVGTITPGELSPSLEEILRLRPALRNVLKDNTTGEADVPVLSTRPDVKL